MGAAVRDTVDGPAHNSGQSGQQGSQRMMRVVIGMVSAIVCVAAGSGVAMAAQTAPAAPPPAAPPAAVSSEPVTTSATYGDWILRCQRLGDAGAAKRVCEVSQMIRAQDGREPIAEVAFGRLPVEHVLHLTALLPPNISFPSSVGVSVADKPGSAADLSWRRCLPGGCIADAGVADDVVRAWRALTGAGRLTFKDANGREIALPLSFRGLAQALDALDKA